MSSVTNHCANNCCKIASLNFVIIITITKHVLHYIISNLYCYFNFMSQYYMFINIAFFYRTHYYVRGYNHSKNVDNEEVPEQHITDDQQMAFTISKMNRIGDGTETSQ